MNRRRNPFWIATCALWITISGASAQTVIEGSIADQLGIGNGAGARAVLAGSAGVGIPLPSAALGIAPGEPVLLINTDLNVVALAGGAIEDASGGVIPSGAAQSVIRAGADGGDVVQAITNQAASIVARAVEEQSGGFVPASAARAVLSAAINGENIGAALQRVAVDIIVDEATRLVAGELGSAVRNATSGFVDSGSVERLFNDAVNGRNLKPAFRAALERRIGSLTQPQQNPAVIVNIAAGQ